MCSTLCRTTSILIYDNRLLDETGELERIGTYPARVQMILVRAADGVSPEALRDAVDLAYAAFAAKIDDEDAMTIRPPDEAFVGIRTWREQLRDLLGPVEKERELMRILFSIVYLVCAGLVSHGAPVQSAFAHGQAFDPDPVSY